MITRLQGGGGCLKWPQKGLRNICIAPKLVNNLKMDWMDFMSDSQQKTLPPNFLHT